MITKRKYTIDTLIGKRCGHGSPGYHLGTPEIIEAVLPYNGKPLNGVVNQELWQINFESGCSTYLKDEDFQTLLKEGETSYKRAAGFSAMEVIEVLPKAELCGFCDDLIADCSC